MLSVANNKRQRIQGTPDAASKMGPKKQAYSRATALGDMRQKARADRESHVGTLELSSRCNEL